MWIVQGYLSLIKITNSGQSSVEIYNYGREFVSNKNVTNFDKWVLGKTSFNDYYFYQSCTGLKAIQRSLNIKLGAWNLK